MPEDQMDTESISSEIVRIKNRLQEIEAQLEGGVGTDVDDEWTELHERLRHLQDQLSVHGSSDPVDQDEPASPDDLYYLPPA